MDGMGIAIFVFKTTYGPFMTNLLPFCPRFPDHSYRGTTEPTSQKKNAHPHRIHCLAIHKEHHAGKNKRMWLHVVTSLPFC